MLTNKHIFVGGQLLPIPVERNPRVGVPRNLAGEYHRLAFVNVDIFRIANNLGGNVVPLGGCNFEKIEINIKVTLKPRFFTLIPYV